ncbi:MAG: CRISPR system precrRNA processing endoribonuclease RAMP protein Cas6 [Chloroflexi bacterium]|nr:CRISPR system precrRNA processing endoribonuclease RAMP protein Cas6 [Chloroflexota bacterium]
MPDRASLGGSPVELLEVHLPLRPLRAGPAPPSLGAHAHGLVFDLLDLPQVAPALGRELHAWRGRAEFTASALLDVEGNPAAEVRPDWWYWLRLAFLSARTAQVWLERLAASFPAHVHLGPGAPFHQPDDSCCWDYELGSDPPPTWAARYADLAADPHDRWALRFVTPTTFQLPLARSDRPASPVFLPLPVPEQVLSSLAAGWQELAPPDLRDLADRARVLALAERIQLGPSHLQVAPVSLRNNRVEVERAAFTGTAVFAYSPSPHVPRDEDQRRRRLLGALLRFGTFAGLGVQSARGMGLLRADPF